MASDDKEYEQSALGKRVNELMDDGYDFGEAVKQAMSEGLKDGGSVGIEILFGPKRDNFIYGGTVHSDGRRGFFKGAQADTKKGKSMSPGTTASGGFRGGNNNNNNNPPPVIIPKDNTPKPITFNEITGKKMLPADLAIQKQFLNLVKKKGYETGLDTEADDLYNAYRTATGLDNFNQNVLVDKTTNILDKEKDGILKTFVDRNSTITDLDTGKSTKQLMVETPTGLIQRTVRPSGIMENDIAQPFGAPQSLSVDPYFNFAEGGRVGLFMGGPALEGQALSIYDSMKAYGFSDQEIANALQGQGLYTPGSTPVVEEPVTNTVQNIINQGGGDGPPGPAPTGTKTYGKTFTGMTMPDGTPIGSSGVVEGVGIIDGLKNAATGLFDLYSKFSPIGIISNFMKQRAEKQQEIQNNAIEKARKEREMQQAIAKAEAEAARAAQYGATNYGKGTGGQSYSGDAVGASGLGFGVGATTGGPVSNKTGKGRQDYSKGGLATMFVEKR